MPVQFTLRATVTCDVCGREAVFDLPDTSATRENARMAGRQAGWMWYWKTEWSAYHVRCPEHAHFDPSTRAFGPRPSRRVYPITNLRRAS